LIKVKSGISHITGKFSAQFIHIPFFIRRRQQQIQPAKCNCLLARVFVFSAVRACMCVSPANKYENSCLSVFKRRGKKYPNVNIKARKGDILIKAKAGVLQQLLFAWWSGRKVLRSGCIFQGTYKCGCKSPSKLTVIS